MTAAAVFLGGVGYTVTTEAGSRAGVQVTYAHPAPVEQRPRIVVYGDSYSVHEDVPWASAAQSWPALVADRVGADLDVRAIGGTGWAHDPEEKGNFLRTVLTHPPAGADVVVLFGGLNDSRAGRATGDVAANAALTMDAVRASAPDAALLVVGPQWPDAQIPALARQHRDAVRDAANARDAVFLDALSWFADRPDLIWDDRIHPNAAGLRFLAGLISPSVAALLRT